MQVQSTRFGSLDIPSDKLITFPDGLLGFENLTRYAILEHDSGTPFKWLQSVDEPDLAFVIVDPYEFKPDYAVELGRDDVVKLGLKEPGAAAVYVLVVIPNNPAAMTANLQGPLVLNSERRVGRQVVLADGRYSTRQPILEELKAVRAAQQVAAGRPTAPTVALAR